MGGMMYEKRHAVDRNRRLGAAHDRQLSIVESAVEPADLRQSLRVKGHKDCLVSPRSLSPHNIQKGEEV